MINLRRISAAFACCLLAACVFGEKVVLGKLGQVTDSTRIYSRPSTNAQVYYKLKPYEYVVVRSYSKGWMKVLLQNRTYAYVQADNVAKLPYQVTADVSRTSSKYNIPVSSRGAAAAAAYALQFVGTPYVWGGNDPRKGIDCSGLVQQAFRGAIGEDLPRTAAEQAKVGTPIRRLEDLRAGDRLYFWDAKRGKIGHTGIYLGNGYFVHSSVSHDGVNTDYLGEKRWLKILVAARR